MINIRLQRSLGVAAVKGLLFLVVTLPLEHSSLNAQVTTAGNAVLTETLATLTGGGVTANDCTLSGRVTFNAGSTADTGTIVFKALQGGFSSMLLTRPTETVQEVHRNDPQRLYGMVADSKGSRWLDGKNLLRSPYWFSPELLLAAITQPAWEIVDQKANTTNGAVAVTLTLQRTVQSTKPFAELIKHESTLRLTVDPTTHKVSAIAYTEASPLPRFPGPTIVVEYSEYTSIQAHLVPLHIIRRVNGSVDLDIVLSTAMLNQGLTEGSFQLQ